MSEDGWVQLAQAVSSVFGWVYFCSWSISFYPQPLLNWRRSSTAGLTVDYPLLNVLGFACYTLYTGALLLSRTIQRQYAERHPDAPQSTVRSNDFAFAVHGFILCVVTYSQFWTRLWRFEVEPGKHASRVTQGIFFGALVSLVLVAFGVLAGGQRYAGPDSWAAIDIIYAASYVKLVVTVSKYVPQVIHNHRAQSTEGWSIHQVLLDFAGGVLSIAQLFIDSSLQGDYHAITGNVAKLLLGQVSLVFNVVFIVQHYILHRHVNDDDDDDDERRPLVVESRRGVEAG